MVRLDQRPEASDNLVMKKRTDSDATEKARSIDFALRKLKDAKELDERKSLPTTDVEWYDAALAALTEIEQLTGALRGELLVNRDRAKVEVAVAYLKEIAARR
jgi:hypothetical protein